MTASIVQLVNQVRLNEKGFFLGHRNIHVTYKSG